MRGEMNRILFISTSNPKGRAMISFLASNFPEAQYFVLKVTRTPKMQEVPEEVQVIADEAFLAVIEEFSKQGISVEKGEAEKVSSKEILDLSPNFDLICIPTTILVKHTERISSTTKEVISKARKLLLIYSSNSEIREEIGDVSLFYDGSPLSDRALSLSTELCSEVSASLHVFIPRDRYRREVEEKLEGEKVPIDVEEIERKEALKFLLKEDCDLYFLTRQFPGKGLWIRGVSKELFRFLAKSPRPTFLITE